MGRLPGFDYKRPFFYMVTLKGLPPQKRAAPGPGSAGGPPGPPFSEIAADGKIIPNAVTEAFERVLAAFPKQWPWVASFSPHVVMPDHLHLMVKLGGREAALQDPGGRETALQNRGGQEATLQNSAAPAKPVALGTLIGQLKKHLRAAYWEVVQGGLPAAGAPAGAGAAKPPDIFEPDFHDWIVKKEGQLKAFRTYIRENGPRAARRQANRQFFTRARQIDFQGSRYWAYGNEALLELPMIVAIKGHRGPWGAQTRGPAKPGAADAAPCKTRLDASGLKAAASRLGPGGAGLSTFLSPLEKDAGNEIIKAGGALIVLSMQGFGERWHPKEKQERLCAAGRMLYLSPYEPQTAKLDKTGMYIRAHALVDWALEHSNEHLEAWP